MLPACSRRLLPGTFGKWPNLPEPRFPHLSMMCKVHDVLYIQGPARSPVFSDNRYYYSDYLSE